MTITGCLSRLFSLTQDYYIILVTKDLGAATPQLLLFTYQLMNQVNLCYYKSVSGDAP